MSDHLEKSLTGVKIMFVDFQMFVEVIYSCGKQDDLDLRGTCVLAVLPELFYESSLVFFRYSQSPNLPVSHNLPEIIIVNRKV